MNKNELSNLYLKNTFVVLNIEITGLNPLEDDIIELSAIKIKNGKIIDRFNSICKPNKKITKTVEKITGITNKIVKRAKPSDYVIKEFLKFADNSILVGYNINYDCNFIKRCARKLNIIINNKTFDCLLYIKKLFPYLPNYKFTTSLKVLGINELNDNSSETTVTLLSEMFFKIIDLLQ